MILSIYGALASLPVTHLLNPFRTSSSAQVINEIPLRASVLPSDHHLLVGQVSLTDFPLQVCQLSCCQPVSSALLAQKSNDLALLGHGHDLSSSTMHFCPAIHSSSSSMTLSNHVIFVFFLKRPLPNLSRSSIPFRPFQYSQHYLITEIKKSRRFATVTSSAPQKDDSALTSQDVPTSQDVSAIFFRFRP